MRVPASIKQLTLIIALLLGIPSVCSARASETVVDYYQQMQQQLGEDAFPYTLHKNRTHWDVTVPDDFVANIAKLIVDEKNGYIYINDEGTGGGNGEVQFVLFRGEGNAPYIMWVESLYSGSQPDESHPHLYAHDGDKWYEKTGNHSGLPNIAFADFLPDSMSIADANALAKLSPAYASIYYKMPRHGTTAQALLSIRDFEYAPLCDGSHSDEPNAKAIAHYCTKLKGKIYYKIDLPWDKLHDKFTLGEKHKEMPDW